MFTDFFYQLKANGVPVTPAALITLHRALDMGLVNSIAQFYRASRTILVKSERHFDRFDQIFAHYFQGVDLPVEDVFHLDEVTRALLEAWLERPQELAEALDIDESKLARLTPEELLDYFKARLADQDGEHHGGSRWIGTGGASPVGDSGYHPGGMRVGGVSRGKSAVKVALDRRYKDYSRQGPLTHAQVGEALKRLRHLIPAGPKDQVNVDETIRQTLKNGGEINVVFDRDIKDRLKVMLAIDNGGWSMDPFVQVVQTLFDYARAQFKELSTFFFHNTIYDVIWQDPARYRKPQRVREFDRMDTDIRMVLVGDASMAPYELIATEGSIHVEDRSTHSSIEQLQFIADTFPYVVWLNPVPKRQWSYTHTISLIANIFPMFELTLDGLEEAVTHLMAS